MNLRQFYQKAIPQAIRQLRWLVMNDIGYIFGDRQVTFLTLDYETYWERKEAGGQLWMSYREILDLCDTIIPPRATILDVGCGNGAFLAGLKQRKPVEELGIDISAKAVELAKNAGVTAKVFDVLHEDITSLGRYEYITAFEVLEHLPNPEQLLSTIHPLGKCVLVTIPNTGYYLQRLRLLFGRFPRQWVLHPGEHLRFWTWRDFQLTAELCGYRIAEVIPIRGRSSWARFMPGLFGEALFFVLKPRTNFEHPGNG